MDKPIPSPAPSGKRPRHNPDDVYIHEANRLLMTDDVVKDYSALFYAGQLLCMYASHSLQMRLQGRDEEGKTLRALLGRMHREAAQGATLTQAHNVLAGHVLPIIKRDIAAGKRQHTKGDQGQDPGILLPFPYLCSQIGGGLKPGQILVLYGADEAVDEALQLVCEGLTKTKVSYSHLVTKRTQQEGLVGLPWWEGCCKTNSKLKEVFKPLANKAVLVIDDMDRLVKGQPRDRIGKLNRIAKRLIRILPGRHQALILGLRLKYGEEVPTARMDSVHVAAVVKAKTKEGIEIFMVAGQPIGGEADGGSDPSDPDISRDSNQAAEGLEIVPGGPQDGEPEGPGEDQG